MKRFVSSMGIRRKFLLTCTAGLILMLAVQFYYYFRISGATREIVDQSTQDIVEQAVDHISDMMEGVKKVAYHISYGTLIQDYLTPTSDYSLYTMWEYQSDMVRTVVETNPSVYDIAIYRADDYIRYQYNHSDLTVRATLDKYEAQLMEDDAKPQFLCLRSDDGVTRIPAYVQPIRFTNPSRWREHIGSVVVMLNPTLLSGMIGSIPSISNSEFFLIDANGEVISGTAAEPEDMAQFMRESNVIVRDVNRTGWKLMCVVGSDSIMQNYRVFRTFALVVALVMILLTLILIRMINQSLVAPIGRLHKQIEGVISSGFTKRVTMPYANEIGRIACAINQMLDRQAEFSQHILQVQQNLYEAKLIASQNELIALENQVNPHFLLNTMQCICGMAVANGVPSIADVTSSMASIFTYSLRSDDVVTLADEVVCLKQYLRIIDFRFNNAFHWDIQIPEALMRQRIVKMVLQPLAENAVYHGLEKRGHGSLSIRAERSGAMLKILIQDDGVGIEPETLRQIQAVLADGEHLHQKSVEHKRIGLANTCWRIRLVCGGECGVSIDSTPGKGTCTQICITYDDSIAS